ncbi:MAG: hypothetical protein EZS28_053796, partial [Streblomastix strix]
ITPNEIDALFSFPIQAMFGLGTLTGTILLIPYSLYNESQTVLPKYGSNLTAYVLSPLIITLLLSSAIETGDLPKSIN